MASSSGGSQARGMLFYGIAVARHGPLAAMTELVPLI